MIVLLEEPEAESLLMLITAVATDNADIAPEGKEAIRKWRSEFRPGSDAMDDLKVDLNEAMNAHIEKKFMRRVKSKGKRAETTKR